MLLTKICEFLVSTVALTPGVNTRVAKSDPQRMALGFVPASSFGVPPYTVSPLADPFTYPFASLASGPQWFTIRDYYNLPCVEWYANAAGATTLTIITIRRN